MANAEKRRKGREMNYADFFSDTRENPDYAELTPMTGEIEAAVYITVARIDKLAPSVALARVEAFTATRKLFIHKSTLGGAEIIDSAYAAALTSFDATILASYGPLVAEWITIESTRY